MAKLWRGGIWFQYGYRHFGKSGYEHARRKWEAEGLLDEDDSDLHGKVILITGANSGLGKSAAITLAQRRATVYMLCRNEERGREAQKEIIEITGNENTYLEIVDVSSMESIRDFARRFTATKQRCDVLINNAGVMPSSRGETDEGLELTFATNTIGTFLLTNLMMPVLSKSSPSRVIIVSSGGALTQKMDLSDVQFEGMKKKWDGVVAYAQTKREQIYLNEIMAEQYKESGVTFYSMHPGWADTPGVSTSMSSFYDKLASMLRTSEQGADTIVWLATTQTLKEEDNGKFFFDRAEAKTHLPLLGTSSSKEEIAQLWEICCEITGWTPEKTEEWIFGEKKEQDNILSSSSSSSSSSSCSLDNDEKEKKEKINKKGKEKKKKNKKSSKE